MSNKKLNKNKSFFSKNQKIICNIHIFTLAKSSTFLSFSNQNKHAKKALFSKNDKILESTVWFSNKKYLKLLTFLPFETPSFLFLPKMGTVLFYSSSFSIINYF